MKKNYILPKILITFCLLFIQTFASAQRDVYLVIGQSNTAGRGVIETEDMVTLTGVDIYNGTNWESTVNTTEGLNRYSTIRKTITQGLNFSYTFGRALNEVTGNQIGLVVNAKGGTNINQWVKGASDGFYTAAISRINAALAIGGSTLKGVLWHQGESSRNDSDYLTKLQGLITDLRTDLGISNLPFIAGELSKQRTDNETFNTNIKTLPSIVNNTDYAAADGLSTNDRTHFISNSQRVLGYRYAAKVLKMIYGYTYVENQIIYVSEDAYVRSGTHANTVQETAESGLVRIKETSTNANNSRRGLLKFDISTLTGTSNRLIIDTSLIINADLNDGDSADSSVPADFSFYDIATSWSESTVTYNNAPNFSTPISSSALSYFVDGLYQRGADITEYIKDEYDNGTTTVALGIKSETDVTPQLKISTKEDLTNFALRPYLLYSYIDTSTPPTLSAESLKDNQLLGLKITYTNPVENELLINSNFNIEEVNIYSITGKHLKTQTANNTSSVLDLSRFISGTYVLVIKNKDEKVTKLIMKK